MCWISLLIIDMTQQKVMSSIIRIILNYLKYLLISSSIIEELNLRFMFHIELLPPTWHAPFSIDKVQDL